MGALLSTRLYYPRDGDEDMGAANQDVNAAANNPNRLNEFQMSTLSSILPQFYTAPIVHCKVNIHKDTIKVVRVDKPNSSSIIVNNNNNDESSSSSSIQHDNSVVITTDNYPVINQDDETSTTSTTTTTTTTNGNKVDEDVDDKRVQEISIQVNEDLNLKSQPTIANISNISIKEGIYNIKFQFDTEEPCIINIYIIATESNQTNMISQQLHLGPFHFNSGLNQPFSLSASEFVDVSKFTTKDLTTCNIDTFQYPVIISINSTSYEPSSSSPNLKLSSTSTSTTLGNNSKPKIEEIKCQFTYLSLIACNDNSYDIKPLKQKSIMGSQNYIVHDIYGISGGDEVKECVACLSEPRDTLIIPCRHFCLCSGCAEHMRTVSLKCPICRSPAATYLKININNNESNNNNNNNNNNSLKDNN